MAYVLSRFPRYCLLSSLFNVSARRLVDRSSPREQTFWLPTRQGSFISPRRLFSGGSYLSIFPTGHGGRFFLAGEGRALGALRTHAFFSGFWIGII